MRKKTHDRSGALLRPGSLVRAALSCAAVLGIVAVSLSGCGGGTTVDDPGAAAPDAHADGGSFTQIGGGIELFVEYPHQIASVESEVSWEIYLTQVDGWQPVPDAEVTLYLDGPEGAREDIAAEPEVEGIHTTSVTLPSVGLWHAEFLVSVDGNGHLFDAGEFEVFEQEQDAAAHAGHTYAGDGHDHSHGADAHAGHDHGEVQGHEHEAEAYEEVDDYADHDHAPSEAHDDHAHEDEAGGDQAQDAADPHVGHDHAAEAAGAEQILLPKTEQWSFPFAIGFAEEREILPSIPVAGDLIAPPGGLVHVTSPVAGHVEVDGPSPGPGEHVSVGQTLALIAPVSLDNSYARTRADVLEAELEAERAQRLFAAGAIPERRVQEAQRNLTVAVAAFEALGGSHEAADELHNDPSHYQLRSPIAGVIETREVALGEQVEAGRHAFTIVDASTLWLVTRVPARYSADIGRVRGAWFTVEGGPNLWATERILSTGTVIDPESRTLPVRFVVPNPDGALRVGMLAEVRLQLGDPMPGVAVPAAAIQDENGLSVVYVKVTGDTFERRVVEAGNSDGTWTLVSGGVELGEQVVTVGAYQVNLAALGVVAPAHDHAH